MIKGITFEIPQKVTNTLWNILETVDVTEYYWINIKNQTETFDEQLADDFLLQECYDGYSFQKLINCNHYIISLKLQAYTSSHNFESIHTYDEFLKSDCQIVILIYDCEFVEIYSKKLSITNSIYQQAIDNGYNNVVFLTDSNDCRSVMDIS